MANSSNIRQFCDVNRYFVSGLVESRPASRRGFRDGCCPPAAPHRLRRQLNDELSACSTFLENDVVSLDPLGLV